MCRFAHFREINRGEIATKGGTTIAYDFSDTEIKYGVAECSRRDNYCRKIGRAIAGGRLEQHPRTIQVEQMHTNSEVINMILENLYV